MINDFSSERPPKEKKERSDLLSLFFLLPLMPGGVGGSLGRMMIVTPERFFTALFLFFFLVINITQITANIDSN
jgi:hypothetical protein